MSKFYLLVPKDQRHNNWVLHTDSPETGVTLRAGYADLRCRNCGKVDEDAALKRGVGADVRIRSKSDYLCTDDGFICLSKHAREVFEENDVRGFRFVGMPGDPTYVIAMPAVFAPTDERKAAVEIRGPEDCDPLAALGLSGSSDFPRKADRNKRCVRCQRFFTTLFLPTLSSMKTPQDPRTVFASSMWAEDCKGRQTWFHASDVVVAVMKKAKLTGVEFNDPY